ncbi:hypothetical protein BHE74_00042893 [Ensete ventricosum]|nr:hypothetical protein BHE74_00042893 [Ensete ventricosum]
MPSSSSCRCCRPHIGGRLTHERLPLRQAPLPSGDCPYGRCCCPQVAPRGQAGVVLEGGTSMGVTPLWAGRGRPLLLTALAVIIRPCKGPSRGRSLPFLTTFAAQNLARTHRTVLRDSISSHAV